MATPTKPIRWVEKNKIWRVPLLANSELLAATQRTQRFPRHTHEQYAIGVVEQGALGFFYRGEQVVAPAGSINLCIPGEAHTGEPASAEGWSYRMFYFDAAILQRIATTVADRPSPLPIIQAGVLADPAIAQQLHHAHRQLEEPHTPLLTQESVLLEVLAQLLWRYADNPPAIPQVGQEAYAVTQIKQYIDECFSEDIPLSTLAALTHLSPYHLIRVFRAAVGVPPHAYLRQVRVQQAKTLLAAGHPIAEVALAVGFADQSHLHRWFKRLWGVTPAQYRNSVQDR